MVSHSVMLTILTERINDNGLVFVKDGHTTEVYVSCYFLITETRVMFSPYPFIDGKRRGGGRRGTTAPAESYYLMM